MVVTTDRGEVRAVDVEYGEVIWAVDVVDAKLPSGVILHGGRMYAMTGDGRLLSIEVGDLRADR